MTETNGRIVRVRTFDWTNDSHVDTTWWAAIDDDAGAVEAVKIAVMARADDHQVETIGVASPAEMKMAGLHIGEVKLRAA